MDAEVEAEQETEGIDSKRELDPGKNPGEHDLRRTAREDVRDHRRDNRELKDACRDGPRLSQIGAALTGARDEQCAHGRNENCQERFD